MFSHPPHILQIHAREIHERMRDQSHGQGFREAPVRGALPPSRPRALVRLRALLRQPGSLRRVAPPANRA